jgi:hypothetical protein
MREIYFGDENQFAIRYLPGYNYVVNNRNWTYCFLNLKLGGHIIGDKDESSVSGVWIGGLERILNKLQLNFDGFKDKEFTNRPDEELFELVWKSNQLESKFDPRFLHLPQLDNSIWNYCSVRLDETIDQYLIAMIGLDDKIKFIWKGLQAPCPVDKIGKLFSVTVDKLLVEKTLSDCIKYVEADYANYVTKEQ